MRKFLYKINPFCKALSIILAALLISITYDIMLNLTIFFISLVLVFLGSKTPVKKVLYFLIPVFLTAIGLFMTGFWFGNGEIIEYSRGLRENMNITSAYNGLQLATRVFSYASLGMIFTYSTDYLEFIKSLQVQLKLSSKFAYGILASFHLLPNIKNEWENAKFIIQVRGGKNNFFSTVFIMFVNAVRWAENISIAMESKGFNENAERILYENPKVKWYDILFVALPNVVILFYYIL